MSPLSPSGPLGFLALLLQARTRRTRGETGASAVEWVIIAAIVVGIAIAVGLILMDALTGKATDIGNEIQNQ